MNELISDQHDSVRQNAERVLGALETPDGPRTMTAWDLKLDLKLPNSALYLALGWLAREGKIALEPQDFTYRVSAVRRETTTTHALPTPAVPAQP